MVDRTALVVADSVMMVPYHWLSLSPMQVAVELDETVFADADDSEVCVARSAFILPWEQTQEL
jgi:hypothetical protein